MTTLKISVLPGDGIGPEVTAEALNVLHTVTQLYKGIEFELETFDVGAERFLKTGSAMTEEAFTHCKEADAIFMGAIGLPEARHPDGREVNGDVIFRLRFDLDLYAGVRPVRFYPGVPTVMTNTSKVDYVVVRENVEGLYASRNGGCRVRDDLTTDTIVITRSGTEKVVKYAFKLAAQRASRRLGLSPTVTCVDKSNVLKSYAFFREVFDDVAKDYPDIHTQREYVDAMAAYQVLNPERLDVLVMENMFGDILSDLAGATVGGLGMAASGDIGDDHAMFQPAHGTAPTIAGKNVANPTATILSAAMMLDWLGDKHQLPQLIDGARLIERAVSDALQDGSARTVDLGGHRSTSESGSAVVNRMLQIGGDHGVRS